MLVSFFDYLWKMEFEMHTTEKGLIAELHGEERLVNDLDDALDLVANASYQGAGTVMVYDYQLHPDFFRLASGLAGEILQKFSNYRMRMIILGDFSATQSKSLRDFIRESNRYGHIIFANNREEVLDKKAG